MTCEDCALFDAENGRCRSGKVNPKSRVQASELVSVLGIRALCTFNQHREALISVRSPKADQLSVSTGSESRTA
jgi:hypothetical protein